MRSSAGGDNSLIPEFRRTMAAPGRKFAFLFYSRTIVSDGKDEKLKIIGLQDAAGRAVSFRQDPGRWRDSFQEVLRLQSELMQH
jgi:hypothetical protein